MIRFLLRRVLLALLTVWAAVTLAFFALAILPGDAILAQLTQSGVDAADIQNQRSALGLTDPPVQRYVRYLTQVVRGDFGSSWLNGEAVNEAVARSVLPTLQLAASALTISCLLGIILGLIAAQQRSLAGTGARLLIALAQSTPIFWTGTLAIYVFTAQLGLLPSAGAGRLSQLILPAGILGFHSAAAIARVVQANVRDVAEAANVPTARSKGLPERRILLRHVLPVALLPVLGVIALEAGFLLNGTVIT
jgi:peptide/nickel transport system permease protein